ncbi:MAG: class I SAM-dependent rRNA methyltransferase [Coxiellaceae bacterium]|nr:class I SAM-dependent rRNA methyltransferase [Coxiellaceae bacterium]
MHTLRLKKDADRRIKAGHLWIFSNDINTDINSLKNYAAGDLVRIETAAGTPIAIGYINPHCLLCIRILTLSLTNKIDKDFFIQKMQAAKLKREKFTFENYARMVFGEADRLPGIVIDQFNHVLVIQLNTAGMENLKPLLIEAADHVFQPEIIVLKCDSSERTNEGLSHYIDVVKGDLPEFITVKENNCHYEIALLSAQKTGWFYDHRFNRARIASYCTNKKVLDVFSYCGAFTIPAAKIASDVTALDRSETALKQLEKNAALNNLNNIKVMCGDAEKTLQLLVSQGKKFDVVILDPPALIKRKKDMPAGEKMYQKLNELALRLLEDNGVLFSASCSMHLSADSLLNVIRKAGVATKKELSVLEQCHQGPDHPIHPAIVETSYLKGFIVGC